jgi:imidazolonepropionase-like amidohydrolase
MGQNVGAAIDGVVRDRIAQGVLPGPRLLTSLRQINDRSGDPEALRALVRRTKSEGVDLIKLFATTGLGAGGNQSMSNEQIQAVCSEAEAAGLRAVVHAIGDSGARAAVLAGRPSMLAGVSPGVVLMDASYGSNSALREAITGLGLSYVAAMMSTVSESA